MPYADIGGFNTAIAAGTVKLAKCLRIERKDGVIFGFTDLLISLDLPEATVTFTGGGSLTVPATTYRPDAGMLPTNLVQSEDPTKTDNMEVKGTLGSYLLEEDVENGLFEGAKWTLILADWGTPTRQQFRARGTIGGVIPAGPQVTFKLRSLAEALSQEVIEVTSGISRYDWDSPEMSFFDLSGNTADGYAAQLDTTITSVSDDHQIFTLAATVGFPDRRFEDGLITFLDGDNNGLAQDIMAWDPATGELTLWDRTLHPVAPGDSVRVRIKCPLTIEEWYTFFGDVLHFGGEDRIVTVEAASDPKYDPANPTF